MFGSFEIDDGERKLGPRDFDGVKPKQLLQILLVHRGAVVPKERLADLLWDGAPPAHELSVIESYVSVVRQRLEPTGTPRTSLIVTESGAYRFAVDQVWLDIIEFDRLIATEAKPDADRLHRAVALVRGDLLEDEPYAEWAHRLRDHYREKAVRTLVDAAQLDLDNGDLVRAERLAERAADLDATAEDACRMLMRTSFLLERRPAALRAFARCQRALAEELGIQLSPETLRLRDAIEKLDISAVIDGP